MCIRDRHMIVRDTGIGVPAAKQETIFEAFTQADSSTTRQYGGTGLGLSITAQLVHMMNGRIWLDSEEGQGSTFHIVVRLEVPSEAGKALPPRHGFNSTTPLDEAAYTLPTLRVLLAEDNELNQKVAVGMLERMGHSVDIVANGIDTLDMLERKDFDLVLMDVQMPELDGLEATAAIRARERERGGHIPIVGLTAHAMTGDPERCLAAGMDDYAAKPIRRDRLFAIFARHFGHSAELLPAPPQGEREVAKVLDQDDLWERFDGDIELFKNARELFLRDAPKLVQKIQQTIASGKANSLASAVHEFKGMAVNLSAGAVAVRHENVPIGSYEYIRGSVELIFAITGYTFLSQTHQQLSLGTELVHLMPDASFAPGVRHPDVIFTVHMNAVRPDQHILSETSE